MSLNTEMIVAGVVNVELIVAGAETKKEPFPGQRERLQAPVEHGDA
jgi:hypothetical protein